MKLRTKLIAAGVAAAAVLLPSTDAGALLPGMAGTTFSGVAAIGLQSQIGDGGAIPVKCLPGSTTGRSSTRMQLWLSGNPDDGQGSAGDLSNATWVKASWPGGSLTLTRAGRAYTTSSSAKFPCPATDTAPMTITFQPYRGSRKVGVPSTSQVNVQWTGPRVVRQFAALASAQQIEVTCLPNGKARAVTPIQLRTTRTTAGLEAALLGDDLNRATKFRASWKGGSMTLTRMERSYTVSRGARFPCPDPNNANSRQLPVTVQAYRGSLKVGAPAHLYLGLYNPAAPGAETTTGIVTGSSGGTVGSTQSPATASDPVETAVSLPAGVSGPVTSQESAAPASPAPTGYTFLDASVYINAPAATAANPLVLQFRIYAPAGTVNENTVKVFRNGEAAGDCPSSAVANPDPCVKSRSRSGDNVLLTVNTSHASEWDFAKQAGAPS
jgi:hypothetical protein